MRQRLVVVPKSESDCWPIAGTSAAVRPDLQELIAEKGKAANHSPEMAAGAPEVAPAADTLAVDSFAADTRREETVDWVVGCTADSRAAETAGSVVDNSQKRVGDTEAVQAEDNRAGLPVAETARQAAGACREPVRPVEENIVLAAVPAGGTRKDLGQGN